MTRRVAAYFGASGSGKSSRVKRWLNRHRPRRALIWDTMAEYGSQAELAPTLTALLAAAAASRREFRLRYVPRGADAVLAARFEAFCALAYELGDITLVVEELQLVTRPSWAPASWSDCTLRGRHRNVTIFGVSQRPASVDKNFFSQANVISTGRLLFEDDVAELARVLCVPREWVMSLPDFHHLELDTKTGTLSHVDAAGKVTELARPGPGRSRPPAVTARAVGAGHGDTGSSAQKKPHRRARR